MADNVPVTAGVGTNVATDDIGGVQWQRIKIGVGADGAANDVAPPAADAVANTGLVPINQLVYNGATYDRVRAASNTAISTGIIANAPYAYNGTNFVVLHSQDNVADANAGARFKPVGVMVYNGATFDRLRGDIANGLDVDVTRVQGTITVDSEIPAAGVLADATADPTTPAIGSFVHAYNGATWDRLRGDIANGLDVDVTRVQGTVTVDSELPTAGALADATANPNTVAVGALGHSFDGTTWNRNRGNIEGTLLASQARSATTACAEQINYNARGVVVILAMTSAPNPTGTVQLQLRGREVTSLSWIIMQGSATSTTGAYVFELYPGVGAAAQGVTARTSGILPRRWDVNIIHSDNGNPATYQVTYSLIL